ncbi:hypothetical protein SCUCBS95973_002120 [Sporothrix curviconia]|uniref:Uncharacterized protein n=1 Tax=Sporothrix curviconia TaxID=1260050 RepID=A0ABP0B4W5_9PEZI
MSLFGRRSSRRERSDSDPPSPRRVPLVEDVFLKASAPGYIRNNTGWENMPAPPYEHAASGAAATTGGPTTGAPYALSNIPAHIYLLQPQQPVTMRPGSSSKESPCTFVGQSNVSTPATTIPPQLVSPYYTYPHHNMYQDELAVIRGSPPATRLWPSLLSVRANGHHAAALVVVSIAVRLPTDETTPARVRSRKFHDANPLRPGKKPIVNFCRKCRSLFDMEHDD